MFGKNGVKTVGAFRCCTLCKFEFVMSVPVRVFKYSDETYHNIISYLQLVLESPKQNKGFTVIP